MMSELSNKYVALAHLFSRTAAVFTLIVGSLVLLGWSLDNELLKSIAPGFVAMKANTALCFVLSGIVLMVYQNEENSVVPSTLARILSGAIITIALLTFCEYLFGWNGRIDELLFIDKNDILSSAPGRMSPLSALNFVFLGIAMMVVSGNKVMNMIVQLICFIVFSNTLLSLIGYFYGVESLYRVFNNTAMAFHTSLTLLVLSLGILAARPAKGMMNIITGQNIGSIVARRLLPGVIIAPFLFGWLRLKGEQAGLYNVEFGVALMVLFTIILFISLVLSTSHTLNRSDRKQKTIEEINAYLSHAIYHSHDVVFMTDTMGTITYINPEFERLYGYTETEVIGQNPRILKSGEQTEEIYNALWRIILSNTTFRDVFVNRTKAGNLVMIETTIDPIFSGSNQCIGFIAIQRDITERRQREKKIAYQAQLLSHVNDAIVASDDQFKVTEWNRAAEILYGWKAEEILGRNGLEIIQTEWPIIDAEVMRRTITESVRWRGEATHIRKDGTRFPVEVSSMVVRDDQAKILSYVSVNRDITERKQAENDIRKLNDELEQRVSERTEQLEASNNELEAFAYSVSHDLRAPLRSIDGFSKAIWEDSADVLTAESKANLQRVRSAAQRMSLLIDDLLGLSLVSWIEMKLQMVDISAIAQGIASELQRIEPDRKVICEITPHLTAATDPSLAKILLENLIGNAWKFTSKQSYAKIEFSTTMHNDTTVYFIRDNGAGFDMRYADKLFSAFQRLHRNDEYPGTGIGLATVQRIVHRHGGRVWAEGKIDQGAIFYFTLR